jgi:hypothetical protein
MEEQEKIMFGFGLRKRVRKLEQEFEHWKKEVECIGKESFQARKASFLPVYAPLGLYTGETPVNRIVSAILEELNMRILAEQEHEILAPKEEE